MKTRKLVSAIAIGSLALACKVSTPGGGRLITGGYLNLSGGNFGTIVYRDAQGDSKHIRVFATLLGDEFLRQGITVTYTEGDPLDENIIFGLNLQRLKENGEISLSDPNGNEWIIVEGHKKLENDTPSGKERPRR